MDNRQAALLMSLQLAETKKNNLAFFDGVDESISRSFSNYMPISLNLKLDENQQLNLFNISSGEPVYPEDPMSYAQRQVEEFLEKRPSISLKVMPNSNFGLDQPNTMVLNAINNSIETRLYKKEPKKVESVDCLYMLGGGMYLQLQYLLNSLDVRNLVVVEPDSDCFYASLHLIDWSEIYRYFDRPGYSLKLRISGDDEKNLRVLGNLIARNGIHRFSRIEVYQHLDNPLLRNYKDQIKNYMKNLLGAVGFLEDEKAALANTRLNVKSNISVLCRKNPLIYQSALVVGNGPSLDKSIGLIKSLKDKVFVISCGSSLGSLLSNGIKPDVHVEQERDLFLSKWIDTTTLKESRSNIRLVQLNACHPNTSGMFDDVYMVAKSKNVGAQLLKQVNQDLPLVDYVNPMVGNFGFQLASILGFDKIGLVGIDCGMLDQEKHHSGDSGYYKSSEILPDTYHESLFKAGYYKAKGNLREYVFTTPVHSMSRIMLEAACKETRSKCYNLSDGALIEGFIPLLEGDAFNCFSYDKESGVLEDAFKYCFKENVISFAGFEKEMWRVRDLILSDVVKLKELFDVRNKGAEEVMKQFDDLADYLNRLSFAESTAYTLISGSLMYISYAISYGLQMLPEPSHRPFLQDVHRHLGVYWNNILDYLTDEEMIKIEG